MWEYSSINEIWINFTLLNSRYQKHIRLSQISDIEELANNVSCITTIDGRSFKVDHPISEIMDIVFDRKDKKNDCDSKQENRQS